MILISSTNDDVSTGFVIDWLLFYEQQVIRINENDLFNIEDFFLKNEISKLIINIHSIFGDKKINISDIKAFWYRRGGINFKQCFIDSFFDNQNITQFVKKQVTSDFETIKNYFIFCIKQKINLGSYDQGNANKLIALDIAQKCGFLIPNTLLTPSKRNFLKLYKANSSIIVKTLSLPYYLVTPKIYTVGTAKINKKDIDIMPNKFFPTFFQKEIEKEFEIRVFFLNGTCYSMAIFSQSNSKTLVDYRNYDFSKPNRFVPYKLPIEIEEKILVFMNLMNLNTGSLDFIYSKNDEYIFLEVNPVGQYGVLVRSCNYNLNKIIAEYLINGK